MREPLYKVEKITDLKDMINKSVEKFSDRPAYVFKTEKKGEFKEITYKQFKNDIDSLGTALINLGLEGKRVAVIGENRYEWGVTYLAVVNGTGIIVPLDKALPANEIESLIIRSGVEAIVYSNKYNEIMNDLIGVESPDKKIIKILRIFKKNIKLRNATIKKNFWKRDYINNNLINIKISMNECQEIINSIQKQTKSEPKASNSNASKDSKDSNIENISHCSLNENNEIDHYIEIQNEFEENERNSELYNDYDEYWSFDSSVDNSEELKIEEKNENEHRDLNEEDITTINKKSNSVSFTILPIKAASSSN